ncbi:MAG: MazG family protein [Lachnospira sp.]|nr:MazG family protein [Lachnospira sp.]
MNEEYIKEKYSLDDLMAVVHKLRQPDGCPWDNTQTYESMKKCVTDEAAEVVEAIDNKDFVNLKEELGDLLLQVIMYADMAAERGEFTLEDVVDELAKKMIRRHPHVFGDEDLITKEYSEVMSRGVSLWNAIKLKEKQERLTEYESLYDEGKISLELLELQRQKFAKFIEKINL